MPNASMSRFAVVPISFSTSSSTGRPWQSHPALRGTRVAAHRVEPWVDVLEGPRLRVVDRRPTVRRRGSLVEDPDRTVLALLELAVEDLGLPPEPEDAPFQLGEAHLRIDRLERHLCLLTPNEERLVPCRDEALAPRYHPALPGPHGPGRSPVADATSAVTGGPDRVYCGRAARTRFGRWLGEDVRRASPPGSHRPRLASARDPSDPFPSSPVAGMLHGRWAWSPFT